MGEPPDSGERPPRDRPEPRASPPSGSSVPPHDQLLQALNSAIGLLEGGLVHAYTAAYRRIPLLHRRLGEAFLDAAEVREVTAQVIAQLERRLAGGSLAGDTPRQVVDRLRRLLGDRPPKTG